MVGGALWMRPPWGLWCGMLHGASWREVFGLLDGELLLNPVCQVGVPGPASLLSINPSAVAVVIEGEVLVILVVDISVCEVPTLFLHLRPVGAICFSPQFLQEYSRI